MTSEAPPGHLDETEAARRGLERIIPDLVKRLVEVGLERLSDGPDSVRRVVGDLKLPREAINQVLSQIDETKAGVYRAVAKEVRDFLGQKSFAEELSRALTALSFEIRTEVRFIPNDARTRPTADVRSKVSVRRSNPSPEPESTPAAGEPGATTDLSEART